MMGIKGPAAIAAIRRATVEDAEEMFALHRASVEALCAASYSPSHITAWFEGRDAGIYSRALRSGRVWVAQAHGRILGFVAVEPGEVTLLFVRPEAAGLGLGKLLFEYGLCRASENFAGPLTVVATRNSTAFYESFGFAAVETEFFVRGSQDLHFPVVRMRLQR